MKAEDVPPQLRAIVDRAAGREHSAGGAVMRCLAEVLTAHEEMVLARAARPRPRCSRGHFLPVGALPGGAGADAERQEAWDDTCRCPARTDR